jgi:O-methyltransferase
VLAACGVKDRVVWVADSFQGLPPKDLDAHPIEAETSLQPGQLAVPLNEVAGNFARYGLLDEQVRFLPGWFPETLPRAPIERLALMRLDGDFYESTIVALESLYPKPSSGGFVIVDDYGAVPGCKAAVDEFRAQRGVAEALIPLGPWAAWWQKQEVTRG